MYYQARTSRFASIAASALVAACAVLGFAPPARAVDEPTTSATIVDGSRIPRVQFTGDPGPYEARLEELAGDLSLRVPLRQADLQAALREMRDLPGLTVRATTRRDESQGNAYALTLDTEYKAFDATIELGNRGPRALGRTLASGEVVANSPFGLRDRVGMFASATTDSDRYRGGGVYFEVPVSTPETLDPTAPTRIGWSAALEWDDLDIERDDVGLRDEKVRVLDLAGRISGRTGAASRYLVGVHVRRGFDDFLVTRLQVVELMRFAQRWTVRVDGFGQHSAYVLPQIERQKLGGELFGRGFGIAQIAGDQGLGAKAQVGREMSGAAALVGRTSLYGFYDFAAAWKQDEPGRESAATAGLGFAIDYWRLSASVEVAKPLTRADDSGDRAARVFAEVRLGL